MRGRGTWIVAMLIIFAAATTPLVALFAIFLGPAFAMANFVLYCRLKKRGIIR